MNCKRAKLELALLAGHDLDDAAEQQVRRHLAECPCCRDHWQSLEATVPVLHQVAATGPAMKAQPSGETTREAPSLWPALSARLDARPLRIPAPQFPRWVPVTAVAAACVALAVYIQQPRVDGFLEPGGHGAGRAQFIHSEDFAELPEDDPMLELLRRFERGEGPRLTPFDERSLQRSVRATPNF